MYEYKATLLRVIDGDTIHLDVDLGIDIHVHLTIRLAGIDAPEMGTPAGQAAKDWLINRLGSKTVYVDTVKDRKEKYGRYLGWISTDADPRAPYVNQEMVVAGHAVERK